MAMTTRLWRRTLRYMSTEASPRFARLQVEVVVEITDRGSLVSAALDQVGTDAYLPDAERDHAVESIEEDETEALAYLIDPFDLVSGVPGVELAQASWSCGRSEYDPNAEDWDSGGDEEFEHDDTPDAYRDSGPGPGQAPER